jgi:putative nucleotidyltransferase with HDIG domain
MNIRDCLISKVSSFPTPPAVAQKLLTLIANPDANISEIEKVIQYDPALTANVLKAANSGYLGFTEPVNSVAEASVRIGMKWLYQIAVSSLIYTSIRVPADGYELSSDDLCGHSIAVAMLSENLSKSLNLKEWGVVFTGGLIHDIGKIALQGAVGDNAGKLETCVEQENVTFEQAERDLLGIDHAEAGALIAEHWNFPPLIIDIIRWHHDPERGKTASMAIDVVHIADALCLMQGLGIGRDGLQYRCNDDSLARLNLSNEMVETAISQVLISIEDFKSMFTNAGATCTVRR